MLNMACTLFRLTPEEALARRHAQRRARARPARDRGTLDAGQRADFVVWDVGARRTSSPTGSAATRAGASSSAARTRARMSDAHTPSAPAARRRAAARQPAARAAPTFPTRTAPRCRPRALAVEDTDWHLDALYGFAPRARRQHAGAALVALRDRPEPAARGRADVPRREQHRAVPDALLQRRSAVPEGQAPDAAEIARAARGVLAPVPRRAARRARRGCGRSTATRVLFDGHSIRSRLPWLFDGPPARPQPRHGRRRELRTRRCAARSPRRSASQHRVSRRSSTAASRAATSRATTASRARGVHAVQLEMCLALLHGRGAPRAWQRCSWRARVQPVLRDAGCRRCSPGSPGVTRTQVPAPGSLQRSACGDDVLDAPGRGSLGAARLAARRLAGACCCEAGATAAGRRSKPMCAAAAADAQVLPGPVLPGLVDAHSHAFQRAFAGLAERREAGGTTTSGRWRERMYGVAQRITPAQLQAIAAQLYVELLRGGYTQVCEFHYLQHRDDGGAYDDPLALSWALADAAAEAGIGLTAAAGAVRARRLRRSRRCARAAALRARRRGAPGQPPAHRARPRRPLRRCRPSRSTRCARRRAGVDRAAAPRSPRASTARSTSTSPSRPREVEDCLAATGARPVEWLARAGPARRALAARARHPRHAARRSTRSPAQRRRRRAVPEHRSQPRRRPHRPARAGSTPASPLATRLGQPGDARLARGTAAARIRPAPREARTQRLGGARRSRAVERGAALLARAPGRPRAAGLARWGLQPGARADLLVVDADDDALLGMPPAHLLDALVFSSPSSPWRDVMVAGRWVVQAYRHREARAIAERFSAAMAALWSEA